MGFSFETNKDPITLTLEEAARLEKSPKIEGIKGAVRGALVAAPIGAAVQLLRNKNPYMGALIASLGVGALTGLSSAATQKYHNLKQEADLRYHLRNIVNREPMVMMPEPQALGEAVQYTGQFGQGFDRVYHPY